MNPTNNFPKVHAFLEKYFEEGSAVDKQHIPEIEQKITSHVKEVFANNKANKQFQFTVSKSEFQLLLEGKLIEVFRIAIKEFDPNCSYTYDGFAPRGGDFIDQSCLFTITHEPKL